jgi:hypothetical protein
MEPIFENVTIETPQLVKASVLFVSRKQLRNNKIMMALGAAAFAYMGIEWSSWPMFAVAVAYVGLFFWQFLVPGQAAKKAIQNKLAYYNQTNPPLTYRFFEDHFELSDIDSWHSFPYDKVQAVARLRNCVLVQVENRGGMPISLEGFQKGTPEELMHFLRTKCPQPNPANWNW